MPDHVRDDMPWDQIASDAHKAFCLSHSPRRTPDDFARISPPSRDGWIAAVKAAVKSYMANDIPEWQKTPRVEPVKPSEEYDPNEEPFLGNG